MKSFDYSAEIFKPLNAIEGTKVALGKSFKLLPTAITLLNNSKMFPLTVNNVNGLPNLPSTTWKPSAWSEKLPLFASKPACKPEISEL